MEPAATMEDESETELNQEPLIIDAAFEAMADAAEACPCFWKTSLFIACASPEMTRVDCRSPGRFKVLLWQQQLFR